MRTENAVYNEAILPEHKGNPLIEALPPKMHQREIMDKLQYYPPLDKEIRKHEDPLVREEYTQRLKTLRQPLPLYFDCFRAIETAIKANYSAKNPFTPTTSQFLHYPVDSRPNIKPKTGWFEPKGDGITLIGESGVGKSSLLEQVLNYFPSVIQHDSYYGTELEHKTQIVWLKVDCPNNSSVRDLCEEILLSIDLALGGAKTKPESTIGKLMRQIEQKIKVNFLGILVIDEMQRLVFNRTGGENNLLNFLHSLVNKLGIALLFCANPPFDETLSKTLKAARRAESGGFFVMEPLERDSHAWECFVEELWDLHWTNVTTELTEDLNDKLHELSAGNVDMASRTYRNAQQLVIGTGDETINVAVLEQAYRKACGLSSQTEEIRNLKIENQLPRRNKRQHLHGGGTVFEENSVKPNAIRDVTRPQHREFELQIRHAMNEIDVLSLIEYPSLLRDVEGEDDPFAILKLKNILCTDPLDYFK